MSEISLKQLQNLLRRDIEAAAQEAEYGAVVQIDMDRRIILIDTRMSRDFSRSRNGGDYNFWSHVDWYSAQVEYREQSSCDLEIQLDCFVCRREIGWQALIEEWIMRPAAELGVQVMFTGHNIPAVWKLHEVAVAFMKKQATFSDLRAAVEAVSEVAK